MYNVLSEAKIKAFIWGLVLILLFLFGAKWDKKQLEMRNVS